MLSDQIRKILNESESGKQKHERMIVKLPCGHASVEVPGPHDMKLVCPKCFRTSYLTWSKTGRHKMEYQQ